MNILVLGGGGREHALCWKLKQSPLLQELYCAGGNAGINQHAICLENVDPCDKAAVLKAVQQYSIDFVVVGPEAPLVAGVSDALRAAGIAVFGPSQAASQLEASKQFMKDLCARAGIPTAGYAVFTDSAAAEDYIRTRGRVVVKADGLAAGKGVVVAENTEEAITAAHMMLEGNSMGDAGRRIVVEDFLAGTEVSFFALVDGETVVPLTTARDHKRAYDHDTGPNTGGMGAYAPVSDVSPADIETILATIIRPTAKAMVAAKTPYTGVLYAGLMRTHKGFELLEYNARFGDPECQVLMPLLDEDVLPILYATATGTLADLPPIAWKTGYTLGVVYAAKGYPAAPVKDTPIILPADTPDAVIFHAGTALKNGQLVSNGGRVLTVVSHAETLADAKAQAYTAIKQIDWPKGFYRSDIGGA